MSLSNSIKTTLALVLAVGAVAPAAASAKFDLNPPAGAASSVTCGKDYSKNSVNCDYCTSSTTRPVLAGAQPNATPSAVVVTDGGFSWRSAAAGAGAALLLVLAGAGVMFANRRRHGSSAVGPQHSSATG
jgi:hypothetical protein